MNPVRAGRGNRQWYHATEVVDTDFQCPMHALVPQFTAESIILPWVVQIVPFYSLRTLGMFLNIECDLSRWSP